MIIKISVPSRFRLKKTATFRTILMQNQGEIHYIGGADVLPAPLTLEEETRTLACLGTEEEKEARSRLIEHNLRLVVYIAKKFDNTSVGVEDLISIGTIGLIKAVNTFKIEKNTSWPRMRHAVSRTRSSCICGGPARRRARYRWMSLST